MKVLSPYSGETVCELAETTDAELERILARAHAAFAEWRHAPLAERKQRVAAGIDWFETNKERVATDITRQMGKPIAQARGEVDGLLERARHMLAIADECLAPDVLPEKPGFTRRIEHEPLGVVLDLAAWNYPLLIAVNVVVPALLAGNVVLLKHSAKTPLCGDHFAAAFPHVTNLILSHEQTGALIRGELGNGRPGPHASVDHVAFTGSVEGGRRVLQHAAHAKNFIDTGLELGGKDPAYVAADADLDFTVPNVVDGACFNAGQSCCAVERVYVHHSLHDEFLERARAILEAYCTGDPLDESTTMGPLASSSALGFLADQVEDAVSRGARVLVGGKRRDPFFEPTLLAGCPNDSRVMQEESFGPLLPVLSVRDDDEALAHMNDSRFGLTASVWTRDRQRAERFGRELRTGTVYQNRCDALDPALPWTGVGDSGRGSTLSRYGFLHLTRRKSLHFRD